MSYIYYGAQIEKLQLKNANVIFMDELHKKKMTIKNITELYSTTEQIYNLHLKTTRIHIYKVIFGT